MAFYSSGGSLQRTTAWSPKPDLGSSNTGHSQHQAVESVSEDADDDTEVMEPPLEDTSHMNFVDGRCTCCPYGYHIDLDFLRYLENMNSGSYLTNLKKIHRRKKQLRKSMEIFLHHQETNSTPPPDIVHSTEHFMNIVDQENKVTSKVLEDIDSSVNATLTSIEGMYADSDQRHMKLTSHEHLLNFSEDEADFARTRYEQKYRTEAELAVHANRACSISSLESQSTYSSEASPLNSSSSTQQQMITTTTVTSVLNKSSGLTSVQLANNMANLLPDDEQAYANNASVSPATLQAIREQMAISLQRMKELEEQVKAIPVLQVRINVLKEEKRLLGLQMKAKSNKMNTRTVGVGDCRVDDEVEPLSTSMHSRFQTVTNINLSQLGLKSVPNGEARPPRPAMRSIGVGDNSVFDNQLQPVQQVVGVGGIKYHEKEFHTEQSTEIREKEIKTVFLGQSSDANAQLRLMPPWKSADRPRKAEKPDRPARRTRSIGVGDGEVFGNSSSLHVHEKELRTIYIADEGTQKKETRNVGILCKAAVRDVGVTYMYELERPTTRTIAIGVGEIGVGEGYMAEGEGGLLSTSTHTTHMALQQMNLAAFHQRHIHINNEQLLAVLDTYLKKDLTSVSTQCTFSTVDEAIQHTVDLTVRTSVGCGTDTVDVEVRPRVQTRSVGIENRPLCMNRLVGTDKGFMFDASTNTFPMMITKTRATNTDQVVMYPAAVNTDRAVQYSAGTETEAYIFESIDAVRSLSTNTQSSEVSTRATNTEHLKHLTFHNFDFDITFSNKGVNTEATSGRKNVYDRAVNTEPARHFHKAVNTQVVRLVDRAINVSKPYAPSSGTQTEVNTVTRGVGELPIKMPSHSTGTGDMTIGECENCHNRHERMRPVAVNTDPIATKSVAVGYQSIREEGHMSEVTCDVYTPKFVMKKEASADISQYSTAEGTVQEECLSSKPLTGYKEVTYSTTDSTRMPVTLDSAVSSENRTESFQSVVQSVDRPLEMETGRNIVIEKTVRLSGQTERHPVTGSGGLDDLEVRLGRTSSRRMTTEEMMSGGQETSATQQMTTTTSASLHSSEDDGHSSSQSSCVVVKKAGTSQDSSIVTEEVRESTGHGPLRVVSHIETSYVGGHPVKKTTNVVLRDRDEQHLAEELLQSTASASAASFGQGLSLASASLDSRMRDVMQDVSFGSGRTHEQSGTAPRVKGRKVVITETRIERKLTGKPDKTTVTTTTTTETSEKNGALRSIMKQPGSEQSDIRSKKEISFSEDVVGGYVSTSSEEGDDQGEAVEGGQGEEEASDSEGSQSSVSYDEGSYDGRAGEIVYTCRDDEAIAQGVPGARMYEESMTQSYELSPEVASSCQIYAQWLEDSTQITTKQLNSALAIIQHEWFKVSSTKTSDPLMVEAFLSCLNDFSSELMQHVVNLADANGNTALHYAVSHCNMEIVNLLLDTQSIDVNKQNKAGYTAIMLASLAQVTTDRQREIISKMFSLGDVNARASQAGQTALMLAVSHGRLNMVQMLLEAGAKVNMQDEDGSTALMCASEHGHTDIVKMLLAQPDCDPTIQDNDGSTALSIAMEAGHRDIGVLLYAHVNFKQGSPILGRGKGKRRTPTGSSSSLSSSSSLTRK